MSTNLVPEQCWGKGGALGGQTHLRDAARQRHQRRGRRARPCGGLAAARSVFRVFISFIHCGQLMSDAGGPCPGVLTGARPSTPPLTSCAAVLMAV